MSEKRIIAVYPYVDEDGAPLYEVVRYDPKAFAQRMPLRDGQHRWELNGVRRVPYRLPQLRESIANRESVFVVEGEKDADALAKLGLCATTNAQGAGWKWSPDFVEWFRGAKRVVVIPDCDEPGRKAARTRADLLAEICEDVRIVDLDPDRSDGYDIADWIEEGNTRADLARLALEAPRVASAGAALLDEVRQAYRRFVVLNDEQATALALWTLHTHAIEVADTTPYLSISSAEKRAGKTRTLEVAEHLVARPWFTGRATPAVLARKIDKERPTLLLDESDAAFHGDREYAETLRGILNTGYARGGTSSVCVVRGANIGFRDLSTFCAKAIAGIGKLPDTVADRSIPILLRRKKKSETIDRFHRREHVPQLQAIRDRIERWASANLDRLRDHRPAIMEELGDRAFDVWEPLLAIADLAGGEWPQRARQAAIALSGAGGVEDDSLGVRLLVDIRRVFDERRDKQMASGDRITSADLAAALSRMEESPWGPRYGQPFDARQLARLLKRFEVKPGTIRLGGEKETLKGYLRAWFEDLWERYIPVSTPSDRHNRHNVDRAQFFDQSATVTDSRCDGCESGEKPHNHADVTDVTDKTPDTEAGDGLDGFDEPEAATSIIDPGDEDPLADADPNGSLDEDDGRDAGKASIIDPGDDFIVLPQEDDGAYADRDDEGDDELMKLLKGLW